MSKLGTVAVIGGGAGTILIAAAQTKPEDAASNLAGWLTKLGVDQLPQVLVNAQTDRWATLLGVVLVLGAISFWLRRRWRRQTLGSTETTVLHLPLLRNESQFFPPTLVGELKLMPMHSAAAKIYSEFRRAFERDMPNREWNNPRKALGLTAQLITNGGKLPIWGIYPPSIWLERLPEEDAATFGFSGDAKELFDQFEPERRYTDIQIATEDFDRRLSEFRSQYGK